MRHWYKFSATTKVDEREICIYDEIGQSFYNDRAVTASAFIQELQALPESVRTLRVRVASPGGNPFDAVAIANSLRDQRMRHRRAVHVVIESLAASAASIISCAGSPIRIHDNALMMIHNPFGLGFGTADELRATAAALDRITDAILSTYRWVSTKTEAQLKAMMKSVTWMDANEAKEAGFVTEIIAAGDSGLQASVRNELVAKWGKAPPQLNRVATTAIGSRTIDPRRVYEDLNRPRTESPASSSATAPSRRSFSQMAADCYGEPQVDASELIPASAHGGLK
jgi:ATP-dependent protease ClpP protease subunit